MTYAADSLRKCHRKGYRLPLFLRTVVRIYFEHLNFISV